METKPCATCNQAVPPLEVFPNARGPRGTILCLPCYIADNLRAASHRAKGFTIPRAHNAR